MFLQRGTTVIANDAFINVGPCVSGVVTIIFYMAALLVVWVVFLFYRRENLPRGPPASDKYSGSLGCFKLQVRHEVVHGKTSRKAMISSRFTSNHRGPVRRTIITTILRNELLLAATYDAMHHLLARAHDLRGRQDRNAWCLQ